VRREVFLRPFEQVGEQLAAAGAGESDVLDDLTASRRRSCRRHSRDLWLLTDTGEQRLEALRRAGDLGSLPEAPQHRAWREAQVAASERIAGFRGDLRGALDEAIRLLEADHESDSNTWFELSEHLRHGGRLYASSIHCLREWPEPDDSQADTDDPPYGQRGRRQIRGWDSEFPY
jgi:hypothetical protein